MLKSPSRDNHVVVSRITYQPSLCWVTLRRVAHAHYDTYVYIHVHARAVLDAMAMAGAMDDAVAVIEDAPQTVSPSEILPAASRCSSLSVVLSNLNTALAGLLEAAATKRGRPAPGRRPPC